MLKRIIACLNITARLCAVALCLLLVSPSPTPAAADRTSDGFLTGYIVSILERDLGWERDSYVLKIKNGIARITLFKDDQLRREAADKQLRSVDGLQGITIVVKPEHVDKPGIVGRVLGITDETEAFPTGDLFRPLLADPKQPQFFVSLQKLLIIG